MAPRVFFITGTSTGFGQEYVKIALSKGDKVVATSRNSSKLKFEEGNDDSLLLLDLDVTSSESVDAAFKAAVKKFGRIDVVVNNAGYGLAGEFESLQEKQIRQQMEINFFGLLKVTQKAMETMRDQKPSGGLVQQVTSIGGQTGVPFFSIYCASKWAVEGFTEAISKEVKPDWGIKFTCIEPGGFRTKWADSHSMEFAGYHKAYDHLDVKKSMGERNGKQPGDPVKGAEVFYALAIEQDPPLRCVVGTDAYTNVNKKLQSQQESVNKYEKLSTSTNVEGYAAN